MIPLRTRLAAVLLVVAACGTGEPSRVASEVAIRLPSSMVLGATAIATVTAKTNEGCLLESPCELSTEVELSTSDGHVISLSRDHVRTPGEVRLSAHAIGTARISATVDRIGSSGEIGVVAAVQ